MACTIDQFLTSDRSPDSGARLARNSPPESGGLTVAPVKGYHRQVFARPSNEKQQKVMPKSYGWSEKKLSTDPFGVSVFVTLI